MTADHADRPAVTETPPPSAPTKRLPAVRFCVPPLQDVTIIFTYQPDGTVVATCRGVVGSGRTEHEALTALGDELLHRTTDGGN